MTPKQLAADITNTANKLRTLAKGYCPPNTAVITIDSSVPLIAIYLYDNKEYDFQGEEASKLLEEAASTANKYNVSVEDVLLWLSSSWG